MRRFTSKTELTLFASSLCVVVPSMASSRISLRQGLPWDFLS
jgi:hypothetical protein